MTCSKRQAHEGSLYCVTHKHILKPVDIETFWTRLNAAMQSKAHMSSEEIQWAEWIGKRKEMFSTFQSADTTVLERLCQDLGYKAPWQILTRLHGASLDSHVYVDYTHKNEHDVSSVLSVCSHEMAHISDPLPYVAEELQTLYAAVEESICLLLEHLLKYRWYTTGDLVRVVRTAISMHPLTRGTSEQSVVMETARMLNHPGLVHRLPSPASEMNWVCMEEDFALTSMGDATLAFKSPAEKRECLLLQNTCSGKPYNCTARFKCIARIGGTWVSLFHFTPSKAARTVYVGLLAVRQKRQGHARLSMQLFERFCRKRGVRFITLDSQQTVMHQAVYESFGFRIVDVQANFYGPGITGLNWCKELLPA